MQNLLNIEDMEKTYILLGHEKQTEIRLIDPHKKFSPKSIFVEKKKDFIDSCEACNGEWNVYVGINERKDGGKEKDDVVSVKTLVIDIDPVRETNTAATEQELEKAKEVAFNIEQDFVNEGFIRPAKGMSGNGIQLWFCFPKIEITTENRDEIEGKIKKFIFKIQNKYNTKEAKIDQIGDLPRIIKVMGTLSIKGENTTERPHRVSTWLYNPGRIEDSLFRTALLQLEPLTRQDIIPIESNEKKESRSELEFGAVCKYIKQGLSKEEVYSKMMAYAKWSTGHPAYKELTYTKALEAVSKEPKQIDYDEEFIVSEGKVDFSEIKEVLKEQHKHLRLFKTIDGMVGLDGDKYYIPKKWLCYFYESSIQKPMQIKVGASHYDNRVHALIIATAGKGKGVIKNTVKQTLRFETSDVIEASGLIHPEQLIGKMKEVGRGKEKHKVEAKGYLGARILIHDEANSIINESAPNSDQSMRIKRTAMDTFGFNLISKKLVDDFIKDALEYYPETNCLDFMHPEQFQNCFFDKGTYRRYVCFELSNNKQLDVKDSIKSLFEEATNYDEQRNMLESLRNENLRLYNEFKFNDDCKNIVGRWIIMWNSLLLNHQNSAVRRFGEMTFFSIKEYFFKNIVVLHSSYGKEVSEPDLTHLACIDTIHFLVETLENYCKFGDIANTSDVWRGAKGMEIKALEYLYRKEALSLESSNIKISKFIDVISELFGVQERQAKGIMSNLKAKGWIGSKQVGQDSSKVWITFKPELSGVLPIETTLEELWGQEFEGCKGCKVFKLDAFIWFIKYTSTRINPIINKKNNIIKDNKDLFCKNKENLGSVWNLNQSDIVLETPNLNVVKKECTPCIPEGISGSVGTLTSTNEPKVEPINVAATHFSVKEDFELLDGSLPMGRCTGCGKSQQEIVAVNRSKRLALCEFCYEKLD